MEDQQEVFEVERITDRSIDKETGGTIYKVKWKGYDEETWEPVQNLATCMAQVKEYESEKRPQKLIDQLQTRQMSDIIQQNQNDICPLDEPEENTLRGMLLKRKAEGIHQN